MTTDQPVNERYFEYILAKCITKSIFKAGMEGGLGRYPAGRVQRVEISVENAFGMTQ